MLPGPPSVHNAFEERKTMPAPVLLNIDGAVATITINRPEAMNAADVACMAALRDALQECARDASIRVVVLRGAGGHFMAGGDINVFARLLDEPEAARRRGVEELIDLAHEVILAIRRMKKPVIAGVEGAAAGFGFSLMSACDFAVAAENAIFRVAYPQLGASPDGGMTYHLTRLVGPRRALEIIVMDERIDARRALELGLVNRVVGADALTGEIAGLAARLIERSAASTASIKELIERSLGSTLTDQLQAERQSFSDLSVGDDFAEGVRAFIGKRRPKFGGRSNT